MRMTMPLGRYVDTDSPVHRLDPRAKLIAMLLYAAVVLMISSLRGLLLTALASAAVMALTRVPFKVYLRSLKPLRWLIVFIFLFPILFQQGWPDGIVQGTVTAGRMVLFIVFTAILTFTTRQSQLIQALEWLLKPFRRFGVSPEKWSLMMNLALRFIPTIVEEAKLILKAQASRGVDFAERSWREKASALITLLIPVTANTFRRAQELTDSMEARGFVPGMPRTHFHELVWNGRDTVFLLGCVLFMALMFMLRFWTGW